ncbi:MAG: helix-turn-helix domain-containing protein [Elstera sp.]
MARNIAAEILEGLEDATNLLDGKPSVARVTQVDTIDVRAVRDAAGGTQAEFSARFGIPVDTLRKWEQGTRQPDAVGRSYLRLIRKDPRYVEEALKAG